MLETAEIVSWLLQRETLEVRYPKGYTYIDKTGLIAEEVCARFPDFELEEANVGRTQLVNRKGAADIHYGVNRAAVGADIEFLSQRTYFEYCAFFFPALFNEVGIKTLTRVGNRTVFHRKFDSVRDARGFVNGVARTNGGRVPILSDVGEPIQERQITEFLLRFEDEKLGFLIRLLTGTSGVELQGPHVEQFQAKLPPATPVAILDVDVYTAQTMAVETLVPEEFVKSNLKMIEARVIPLLKVTRA